MYGVDQSSSAHAMSYVGAHTGDSADWNLPGDFTIEVFGVKFDSVGADTPIVAHSSPSDKSWNFYFSSSTPGLQFLISTDGTNWALLTVISWSPTAGTAYDLCVERSGSTIRFYVDGSMIGSLTSSLVPHDAAQQVTVGYTNDNSGVLNTASYFGGSMKALRITKVARYASDGGYTVPSLPLPTL